MPVGCFSTLAECVGREYTEKERTLPSGRDCHHPGGLGCWYEVDG